jgi:C_GCAxxG_C_C family probable redox protein
MNHIDKAAALFEQRYNCAQAVFAAFAERLGLDEAAALKLSCGFGGGMGRMGGTCGAVTGAFMAIGLAHGRSALEDLQAQNNTHELVREFTRLFLERHPSTVCRELIGVDLLTTDAADVAAKRYICEACVRDAAVIAGVLSGDVNRSTTRIPSL